MATLRATRALLDAQALTVRLIRAAEELDPSKREEPANSPAGRLPHSKTLDSNNATNPAARSAQTRNDGNTCPISGEVLCPA